MSASLLPSTSGAFEHAVSQVSAPRRPLPSHLVRQVKDPDLCPADLLPVLAAEYSVDIWIDTWPEAKKRDVIRNAIKHHRLKGTLAGISAYAELVGSEVVSIIRPPAKFFASPSNSIEQRRAWLEALPLVKIYRNVGRADARPSIFAGSGIRPRFLSGRFAVSNLAGERSRKRALLIRDGVETEIGVGSDFSGERRVLFYHPEGRRLLAGRSIRRYASPSTATHYIARISSDQDAYDPAFANPLRPAGTGGGIFPTFSSDIKSIRRAWFARARANRRFAGRSDAAFRTFEQIPLADELTPVEPARAISFASFTRLAVPPHTAELKVLIPGKASRNALFASTSYAGRHAAKTDKSRLRRTYRAMSAAKRLSDAVLVNTRVYRPVLAGQSLFAGQPIFAGQMTRS